MLIALTEEEYAKLKAKADSSEYYESMYNHVRQELAETRDMYAKLLVFGAVIRNEKLKQRK